MEDLAFLRFEVRHDGGTSVVGPSGGSGEEGVVAGYCVSVGCLNQGKSHHSSFCIEMEV